MSAWDLWWTKWHWDRDLSQYLGYLLSVSLRQFSIHLIYPPPTPCRRGGVEIGKDLKWKEIKQGKCTQLSLRAQDYEDM
jgi:hypothetical protein